MSETGDTLQALRDRQLSWGLRAIAIVGVFLLLVSLLRAVTVGWQPVMTLHIFLYLLLLLLAIISRRLPFSLRAGVVIFTCFIAGVAGLIMWGLVGMGASALFICCILATIFFGHRAGTAMVTISVLVISVIGFLVVSGALTFNFDPFIYTTSYTSWVATLCAMAFVGGLIVLVLGTLGHEMENLVETLKSRNTELSKTIVCLESEMAELTRIEEERRKLEEHLKHAKRMEDLGTLAAGVAHDLNNVLVGAVSYPDLILKQLPQGSPLRESLEQIKRSGVKAAAIVQDLLTLARRGVVSTQAVDLNSVIGEYVTSLEFEKLKSFHPQVEMELNLGKDLPDISGSPLHLSKAIMNLVSNAAEAMPDGGKIFVSTSEESTSSRRGLFGEIEGSHYVVLRVSDSGVGIEPEDILKIFEPFFTKKVMGRSGTGLGMAVVWGTVKDHNGHIDVESVVGKGTTFTVYFTATAKKTNLLEFSKDVPQQIGNGESILIVDDVAEQREITTKILQELGYSVDAVKSGELAIAFLKKRPVDLLMLDMYMEPGMDGLDTYRQVLKLHPNQKAIIASSYAETSRVREALKLGAGSFIRKPFFMDTISKVIRAELDKRVG